MPLIFASIISGKEGKASEMKYRAVLSTRKQTCMQSLELFLTMFNLAKNLLCESCPHAFN